MTMKHPSSVVRLLLLLILLLMSPHPSLSPTFGEERGLWMRDALTAAPVPSPEELFDRMRKVNPELRDYTSYFDMSLKVKFPLLNLPVNLNGIYYFKQPDKHKLVIKNAPSYLSRYPQIFGWHLPNPQDFDCTVRKSALPGGKVCYIVEMTPKENRGDLQKQEIWVDEKTSTFPRQKYFYKDEGRIELNVSYRNVRGFKLFDLMTTDFYFPRIKLEARSKTVYRKFEINRGLPDSIFEQKKKQHSRVREDSQVRRMMCSKKRSPRLSKS